MKYILASSRSARLRQSDEALFASLNYAPINKKALRKNAKGLIIKLQPI